MAVHQWPLGKLLGYLIVIGAEYRWRKIKELAEKHAAALG